jgi:hypothetical protein
MLPGSFPPVGRIKQTCAIDATFVAIISAEAFPAASSS